VLGALDSSAETKRKKNSAFTTGATRTTESLREAVIKPEMFLEKMQRDTANVFKFISEPKTKAW
jgi:hypothetical protein